MSELLLACVVMIGFGYFAWFSYDAAGRIGKLIGRVQWLEECERVRARRELIKEHPEVLEYEAWIARQMTNMQPHERLRAEAMAMGWKGKES